MQLINKTLKEFIRAVQCGEMLSLDHEGEWKCKSKWESWILQHLHLAKHLQFKFLQSFIASIDKLERIPIRFEEGVQSEDFPAWIEAIKIVEIHLLSSDSDTMREVSLVLRQSHAALLYRLEKENGGLDRECIDLALLEKLYECAEQWKWSRKIFWNPRLTHTDAKRLEEACHYPEFIKVLLRGHILQNHFFSWVLQDGIEPAPFIEFPFLSKKIVESSLSGRIGKFGGRHLKVQRIGGEKHLTLCMEGVPQSLLSEQRKVCFRGNYCLTVKQIFEMFRCKYLRVGNLELFEQGIVNWNSHCLGWWNDDVCAYEVIDLEIPRWWEQLPILEILSLEEAQIRYGRHVDGNKWVLTAKASREFLSLNFDKTHAYLEMAIPLGKGLYQVFDFGKFAAKYPANWWEIYSTIAVSVPALIAYPDENVYYTHRQHVGYVFWLMPEQGIKYMDSIKDDILQSRASNSVFQIETENCGRWIQTRLEEHLGMGSVPNLFQMTLVDAEPEGILKYGWGLIHMLPKSWQARFLALCQFPLGAWKGCWVVDKHSQKVWKSLMHSTYWEDGVVYLPAFLHNQQETKMYKGLSSIDMRHLDGNALHFSEKKALDEDPFASLDLFDEAI